MVGNVRTWLVVSVLGLACAGAAGVVYGPGIARNVLPQFFLARAAAVTAQEFLPSLETAYSMVPRIQNEALRQELTLGMNSVAGPIVQNVDPAILALAPMLSLRNVSRWDMHNNTFAADLALQMAATILLSANFQLEPDRIAFNVPMLFDQSLVVNPRRLGSEWDESILGGLLFPGLIDDQLFYQFYHDTFFGRMEEINLSAFFASLPGLLLDTDFEFLGQELLDDSEQEVDTFRITVPAERANNSWSLLVNEINIPQLAQSLTYEDLIVIAYVRSNRLVGVNLIAASPDLSHNIILRFPEAGNVQFELISYGDMEEAYSFEQSASGYMSMHERSGHHAISFTIATSSQINAFSLYSLGAQGNIRLFPDVWRVEADVQALNFSSEDIDISLNARYFLFADTEPVLFFDDDARLLTDLNIFDLLGMYTRIESSPLAGIFGNLLP